MEQPSAGSEVPAEETLARVRRTRQLTWVVAASLALASVALGMHRLLRTSHASTVLLEYYGGDPVMAVPGPARESAWREFVATQQVIITSYAVCSRAVDQALASETTSRSQGRRSLARESLIERVRQGIRVARVGDSRVVRIDYTDEDPKRAALVVNAIANVYLRKVQEDRSPPSAASGDWSSELGQAARSVAEAELALQTHMAESGAAASDGDAPVLAAELTRYAGALADIRVHTIELKVHVEDLEHALKQGNLRASRLDRDETFRALRARRAELLRSRSSASVAGEDGGLNTTDADLATLDEQMRHHARTVLDMVRAELRAAEEQERRLVSALQAAQQIAVERELRSLESSKLRRRLELEETLYKAQVQGARELVQAWTPGWSVRIVDRARESSSSGS